jgi:hypothetical protein
MRGFQACAAIAASISVMLSMSACSIVDLFAPPPIETAFHPQPAPPAPAIPQPQRAEPTTPQAVREEIWRWFMTARYKDFQVEALMDHAEVESGFRPCAAGPGGYRYLYQWSSTRLRHLHDFARTDECPPLDTQLAFANDELRNDPKFACFWEATTEADALHALRGGFGGGSC